MNQRLIAKLACVSPSTVSKALSGSAEVNPETAEKIRRIAMETGYFKEKSKRKRHYTNNKSTLLAFLVPEVLGYYYASIITCLKNEAEAQGAHVAVYIYDFDSKKCRDLISSILLRNAADGIILFSNLKFNEKPDIPILCFSNTGETEFDSIGHNTKGIVSDAIDYLKSLGHSKIGFVGELYTIGMEQAFENCMQEKGLPFREDFVYVINDRFEGIGIKAAEEILSQKERPTAIMTAYDEIAIALIHVLMKNGIKVPDDISVMGIHNIPSTIYTPLPLTTVETFSEADYKAAVRTLLDKIHNESRGVKHIEIKHQIIPRETTKALK